MVPTTEKACGSRLTGQRHIYYEDVPGTYHFVLFLYTDEVSALLYLTTSFGTKMQNESQRKRAGSGRGIAITKSINDFRRFINDP